MNFQYPHVILYSNSTEVLHIRIMESFEFNSSKSTDHNFIQAIHR